MLASRCAVLRIRLIRVEFKFGRSELCVMRTAVGKAVKGNIAPSEIGRAFAVVDAVAADLNGDGLFRNGEVCVIGIGNGHVIVAVRPAAVCRSAAAVTVARVEHDLVTAGII